MFIALIFLFAFLVLLLFLHLLIGKEIVVEKSITINQPVLLVYDYLRFVKNQDEFSVWNMKDPNMKKEHTGTDGEIGFIYKWDSANKNVGSGEQEILRLENCREIQYALRFQRPMKNESNSIFKFISISPDQTNVQWGFYGKSTFPMSLMKSVFIKMLGNDITASLKNLKTKLEP